MSSSELFCHQFATAHAAESTSGLSSSSSPARDVFYVATDAPTRGAVPDHENIHHNQDPLSAVAEFQERSEESNDSSRAPPVFVIDRFSDLLESGSQCSLGGPKQQTDWFETFQTLAEVIDKEQTVGLLHLHVPQRQAPSDAKARVLSMSDAIFNYQSFLEEDTPDQLSVPKIRGASPPEKRLVLEVSETLTINPDRQV